MWVLFLRHHQNIKIESIKSSTEGIFFQTYFAIPFKGKSTETELERMRSTVMFCLANHSTVAGEKLELGLFNEIMKMKN